MDRFKFVEHIQCKSKQNYIGLKRWRYFTKIIDLSQGEDKIFGNFGRNTRHKIQRAKREGIICNTENNLEQFVEFYNLFAEAKSIAPTSVEALRNYGDYLVITKAMQDNSILVMHAHLIDEEERRVRATMSASLYRYEDNQEKRNLIGRANRFLFFKDMLFFKECNFTTFDFGGYGGYDILVDVDKFKDGFGGILLEESIYTSHLLRIYRFLLNKAPVYLKKASA